MGDITLQSLYAILPELYLCAVGLFLLMVAVLKCKRCCNAMVGGTLAGFIGTAWYLAPHLHDAASTAFNGLFASSSFIVFSKLLILAAASLVTLVAADWLKANGGKPSEFLVLMLFATLGMLLMVSANDMLSLYMALEMSSLALYVLASFERDHAKSSEAGLKYFVLGALASGMMLFGMSLVYGFAGTTGFEPLSQLFTASAPVSKGVLVGMVFIIIGFCFKISAVPFHMWAPDVYEGAPTPVTAFFATAPKIAALALFVRVLLYPFGELLGQWQQVIIVVSIASMLVGALAAIMQSNIKRLLAYSSIGHVGFMLMGVAAGNVSGVQAMLIYLALYIFMSAGAFGCVLLMRRDGGYVEQIRDLAGMSRSRPILALVFSAFIFSMAGIPPLAGFFGKMYVVLAAVNAGLTWLAVIGVATSVVGGYYYIRIVKVIYFDEAAPALERGTPALLRAGLIISAAVTLLFFLMPTPLVSQAQLAAQALVK